MNKGAGDQGDWRLPRSGTESDGFAAGIDVVETRLAPLVEAAEAIDEQQWRGPTFDALRAELARLRARP